MKTYGAAVVKDPRIDNLGIKRRWVVIFTPRPLYPWEKEPPILTADLGAVETRKLL
jgi:hypothetical protein